MTGDPHASWLEAIPAGARRALLGVTAVTLVLSTALSGALPPGPSDALAVGAVVGLAGAWLGTWAWQGRPAMARLAEARRAEAEDRARDRGLLVSSAAPPERTGLEAVIARDPAFSLPVLQDLAVALDRRGRPDDARIHGPIRVLEARADPDRTRLSVLVPSRGPDGAVTARVLRLSRPPGATSPAPEAVAAGADGSWRLDGADPVDLPPPAPIHPDPGMPAARRALLLRAEAFDLDGFEAVVEESDAALDDPEALAVHATPAGAACARFFRAEGLPPTGPTRWIAVEEDGWTERIEVRRGGRVLGLLRPAGQPEAPWRLWRLRRDG